MLTQHPPEFRHSGIGADFPGSKDPGPRDVGRSSHRHHVAGRSVRRRIPAEHRGERLVRLPQRPGRGGSGGGLLRLLGTLPVAWRAFRSGRGWELSESKLAGARIRRHRILDLDEERLS
jgi:hypothetical protein